MAPSGGFLFMRTSFRRADTGGDIVVRTGHQLPGEARNGEDSNPVANTYVAGTLFVIEPRSFVRDCIVAGLADATGLEGIGVISVEEYSSTAISPRGAVVVICAMGQDAKTVEMQVKQIRLSGCESPIVVMSDANDVDLMMKIMDSGVAGFMPSDISLEVAAQALRLVLAGGQYFPVGGLLAARRAMDVVRWSGQVPASMFTRRQLAVIEALRKGKANKIIAYELNMCESTVKVHVRHIMKKLNAKNRTEVAYLANQLLQSGEMKASSR